MIELGNNNNNNDDEWDVGAVVAPVMEPAPAEVSTHRAHRQRRLFLAIGSSILIRPLSLVIPVLTIPLFLGYLGKDRYGLYETIGAIAAYLAMTNAGLSMGLMNKLTDCAITGDWVRARRYVSTTALALLGIAFVFAFLISVIVPFVDWLHLLGVSTHFSSSREVAWSIWTASIITVFGMTSSIANCIYTGLQEIHRANLWEGAARVATLIACFVICWWTNWGVVGVLLAISGAPTLCRFICSIYVLFIEKPQLRPSLRLFEWSLLTVILSEGVLILVLQTANLLLVQADKLVVSHYLGADQVAGYAILGRIYIAGYGVFMLILSPLWPASGDAIRRGDFNWVRKTLRLTELLGPGTMILCGVAMLFSNAALQRLLTRFSGGDTFVLSRSLICAVTLTFVTRAWVDCRSLSLNSVGVFKPQIYVYASHAVLNLALAILLVRPYGVEGVAWSTPITALFTSVWGYPYLMRRYIFAPKRSA